MAVPSPTLLDLALQLHDAGIDVELTGKLRDLLRQRLAKAVDDAVKLLVERTGAGFAGARAPKRSRPPSARSGRSRARPPA